MELLRSCWLLLTKTIMKMMTTMMMMIIIMIIHSHESKLGCCWFFSQLLATITRCSACYAAGLRFYFPIPLTSRPLPPPPLNFLSSEPLQIHTYDHDRNDDFCGAVFFFLFSLGWPLRWSQLAPCNIIRLGHHHILPNSQARSSYSTTTKQAVLLLPLYTSNVMNLHDDIPLAFGV